MGKGKKRKNRPVEADVPGHVLVGAILDEQQDRPAYGLGQLGLDSSPLTPAMRELFGDAARYAVARYSSEAAAYEAYRAPAPAPDELPAHDLNMPHRIDMVWEKGVEGCPPGCPCRLAAENRCPSCWNPLNEKPRVGCPNIGAHCVEPAEPPADAVRDTWDHNTYAVRREPRMDALLGPPLTTVRGGIRYGEAGAPRPAPETPEQRATRLDREREDARRTYSAAVHAADEAWRAIGGRP